MALSNAERQRRWRARRKASRNDSETTWGDHFEALLLKGELSPCDLALLGDRLKGIAVEYWDAGADKRRPRKRKSNDAKTRAYQAHREAAQRRRDAAE